MSDKYILLCQYCSWKKITDLKDSGLYELKNDTLSNRKFRCPKCGRAVCPRSTKDPQGELNNKLESERIKEDNQRWIKESFRFQEEFLEEKKNAEREENQPD